MSTCAKIWDMTLKVEGGKTVLYQFNITDLGSNNISGTIKEGALDVSTLTGTCVPVSADQAKMRCIFNLRGLTQTIKLEMEGEVNGNKYDGSFKVVKADTGVIVDRGTKLAEVGDTGTSGGTATTTDDRKDSPPADQTKEQDTPAGGDATPAGKYK
jgi:hypothetical protein